MTENAGRPHIRDRVWTLTAIGMFLVAVLFLVVLAAIGFYPAAYFLIVVFVGAALVIYGTRLHGPRH